MLTANIYTPLARNGSVTTLLLEVSTQRNFVADFIRLNLNFIHKNDKFVFGTPFGGVRGSVRTLSVSLLKSALSTSYSR